MKQSILILFFILCAYPVSAQSLIDDFFKGKSKQEQNGDTIDCKSSQDSIIFVDPSGKVQNPRKINYSINFRKLNVLKKLSIVRQDYSLYNKKKKVYYGYNDQDFFGSTYSLGIKCNEFTILSDEAVYPWKYDSKYSDFKDKKLEPQVTKTQVLILDDSVSYNYSELDSALVVKKAIRDDMFYAAGTLTSSQDGFEINTSDSCKAGVLVWIVKKSGDLEKGDLKVDFRCVAKSFELLGNIAINPPADCKDVLGCLYLTESNNKEVPYLLSGVASLKNQQWTLYFPFKNFQLGSAKEIKKSKEKGRLTEIKPRK